MNVYTPPVKPYSQQAEALDRLDGQEAFALRMGMRTGKSKTILDDFGRLELAGEVKNLLVLAPGGVYETWGAAINGNADLPTGHLSSDLKARALVHVWKSGSGVKAKRDRATFLLPTDRPRILIMNVEALSSVADARAFVLQFLFTAKSMVVVDESTCIKNPQAKRTKFILDKIAPMANYRRILTGLIAPRSPLDVFSQFWFLNWKIIGQRSWFAFRARYARMAPMNFGGRTVNVVTGYRNVDELTKLMAPYSYVKRLEDCYDVPKSVWLRREVPLTDEQARLYREMLAYATTEVEKGAHVTATIVIAQMMRLHQILCGHVRDENGVVHTVAENRTGELLAALEEYDGKAIIWCSYDEDIQKVSAALKKEYGEGAVARFWGGNRPTREAEEARFKSDPECRFMVATPDAGGMGRTWSVANLVIYYSSKDNLEHRDQSQERPKGIGKTDPITYIDLITSGTVEEKIIHALRQKINMSDVINGANYREWLI